MEALLKHLIEITGQRDHAVLESCVVSALHELVGAKQVRIHELFHFRNEWYMRPKVWINDSEVVSLEETLVADQAGEPMKNYPALVESIKERRACAEARTAANELILWLPIWLHDKVSTCIEVTAPKPDNALELMEGILSVYRNYQSLLDYSERDSLTSLLNRKTFDEKFSKLLTSPPIQQVTPEAEVERRQANEDKSHWLGVVDIDHFKRVNDQFGHLYGDEVLILVANLLRSSFRSLDRVFRFGGEEFVVLLRSATVEQAHMVFERFRTKVEAHRFPQVGQVTVSIGFSCISKESPVVILGHADQALYYAKSHGRNRVCNYEALVAGGELRSETANETAEFFFD